jgi:preprotein translocase subunit SecA
MEVVIEVVGKFLGKVFGTSNDRTIRKLRRVVEERINPLEDRMRALPEGAFRDLAAAWKDQIAKEERTLDELLPEVFAAVREASRRLTKMRHFDVQLIGGMVLHHGNIAEMTTGEGKTLVATLPLVLNALTGRGVHLITVNDYLARRDAQWMGPIYHAFGLSVGILNHDVSYLFDPEFSPGPPGGTHCMQPCDKIDAYRADITYGTNNEFGFDYLRDNMKVRREHQCQRDLYFAIVDEVDSILIDEARTPLIISGAATETKMDYYMRADRVARALRKGEQVKKEEREKLPKEDVEEREQDFYVKEKEHQAILTERGILKAQQLLGIEDMYTGENSDWEHYIITALKAHHLYKIDRDYIEKDGEIIIVDEFTGRLMPGRRWSDGLHESVEVKEGVKLKKETQTLATITLQNYFRMYEKLAGMTGTAMTEAGEFNKIYKVDVLAVPSNKPMRRTHMPDVIYGTEEEKFDAIADEIERVHKTGRPILVGTTSIEKSEYLAKLLKMRGVKHEILNAKHHEREAQIIAKAGQRGAVTISTNMAGRGTDILLGEGVAALGGLHVLGTERHEARRIDNQLRGRAGRQGDPGSSQFFLSLEDDVFRKFAPPWFKGFMQKMGLKNGERIESRLVTRSIEKAQKNVETRNFDIRKNLLEYDEIMDRQRTHIYKLRQSILEGADVQERVLERVRRDFLSALDRHLPPQDADAWKIEAFCDHLRFAYGLEVRPDELSGKAVERIEEELWGRVTTAYAKKEQEVGVDTMRQLERLILLDAIDDHWKDHLYNMDQLRDIIGLRGYAQMDPKLEYKREATAYFQGMEEAIDEMVSRIVFRLRPMQAEKKHEEMARRWQPSEYVKQSMQIVGAGAVGAGRAEEEEEEEKLQPIVSGPKTGQNAPCPCGSGRKYKKCCGRSA